MVEVSKPVNLGSCPPSWAGCRSGRPGPMPTGLRRCGVRSTSAALAGAVAAHVAEPTPDTPDVPSVEQLLADLLEVL